MQCKSETDYWAIMNFLLTLSSKEASFLSNPDQTVIMKKKVDSAIYRRVIFQEPQKGIKNNDIAKWNLQKIKSDSKMLNIFFSFTSPEHV